MSYLSDTKRFNRIEDITKFYRGWDKEETRKFSDYEVRYFDWGGFLVEGFVPYIYALANLSGDKEFFLYDLDWDAKEEFHRLFKKYPIVELKASVEEKFYYSSLVEEPGEIPGRTYAAHSTSKYIMFPLSMRWCVYGEYNIELARLVSKVGLPPDSLFPCEFYTEEEAMARIKLLDTPPPQLS